MYLGIRDNKDLPDSLPRLHRQPVYYLQAVNPDFSEQLCLFALLDNRFSNGSASLFEFKVKIVDGKQE